MAIYNWRYVDSDWYSSATERNMATGWAEFWVRTPGGAVSNTARPTVVTQPDNSKPSFNESMWVNNNQTSPTFSNAEVFWLQSQWYRNLGDNAMANAYGSLANNLWNYSRFANNTLQGYDSMLNFIRWNEEWLQRTAWNLYNQLSRDIQDSRDYVNRMFGPNGELTREVNTYYDDLGNYLSTEAWRQAANIAAQWVHSWASLWAIRAQQNQAYNEAFGRYVQAKEQQINAKQQLAANLINYMSTLRQEYWDTTNQYVIDLYKRANDMYNSIAQSAAADLNQYNQLRASRVGNLWKSTTDTPTVEDVSLTTDSDWNQTYFDPTIWVKYTYNPQGRIIKTESTVYWPVPTNSYAWATANSQRATYWLDNLPWRYVVA